MEPTTMMAIAQAGVQVYGMLRSSGGGIGDLIAAQTRMLAELGTQISIVNEKLTEIHRLIRDLKGAVHRLPEETALETVKTLLDGKFIAARTRLESRADYERYAGMAYAVEKVRSGAESDVRELFELAASLMADGSDALVPFVAAAWYTELQLRASCLPFDDIALQNIAEQYHRSFEGWLRNDLEPRHRSLNAEAAKMRDNIKNAERRQGYDCLHSLRTDVRERRVGGGGGMHGSGPTVTTNYIVRATHATLKATPSAKREVLVAYRDELGVLTDAGVAIDPAFFEIAPWHWKVTENALEKGFEDDPRGAKAHHAKLKLRACAEPAGFARAHVAAQNQHENVVEDLFANAVVTGNLLLLCREAEASTRRIIERIATHGSLSGR